MTYQVLYRKYRPSRFEEVVGQEYVVKTLLNSIKVGKLSHAYLFCGPRGTGKTSIAKLFAKTLNCESDDNKPCGMCENCKALEDNYHPDIVELDAASNNGVDNIRAIIEQASYQPLLGKYRIYILDEVHMLSLGASNSLLKVLEEPPHNVIFILATTDPQKLLPTIISRCQRYNFTKVNSEDMKSRLKYILDKENYKYEEKALDIICELSEGCVRDALTTLDQALAYANYNLTTQAIYKMFGILIKENKLDLIKDIKNKRLDDALVNIKDLYLKGIDLKMLTQDLLKIFKETIIYKETNSTSLLSILNEKEASELSLIYSSEELVASIDVLLNAIENYAKGVDVFSYFEITLIKLASIKKEENNTQNKSDVFDEEIIIKPNKKEVDDIKLSFDEINLKKEELLYILKSASKEEKNKDVHIYQNLRDYSFDPEKRKFFSLLKDTEIFADTKDIIILHAYNDSLAHQINDRLNNEELYYFLYDEFNIDKMVYAISTDIRQDLTNSYRRIDEYDLVEYEVKRYTKKPKKSIEETLNDLFDNVEIKDE